MEQQSKFDVLKGSSFFHKVPDMDLRGLASSMEIEYYSAGEALFEEGEAADHVFVVMSGELDVYLGDTPDPVRQMTTGDVIGEYALFTGLVRTGTVKVRSDAYLLSLENSRFLEFLQLFPNITIALLNQTVQRLLGAEQRLREVSED